MWKCQGCEETIDDEFGACWQCGAERGSGVASTAGTQAAEPLMSNGLPRSQILSPPKTMSRDGEIVQALTRRYKDAYRSARWLIWLGGMVKLAAIGLFLLIGLLSIFASSLFALAIPAGLIGATIACTPIYILGVLTSGQGQTNLATLDTAVNTSRHLSKDDVAALLFD